ncbi:MAG: DivIVA domain-containing protein [Deltaproteobacteria bacterium]|nr:DivIVA domain-containing protein [Deltaproteobacteria bacterium]
MSMTPLDIQQRRFRGAIRGLDKTEVDAFLNLVASEFESLVREVHELRDDQRHQRRLLDEYRAREQAIKDTMITAQRVTEEITNNAKKEADIIIGRAELESEKLIERAQERLTDLLSDIAELKRQRVQVISELKGVLGTHQKLVELAEEHGAEAGVEQNLKVMPRRALDEDVSWDEPEPNVQVLR